MNSVKGDEREKVIIGIRKYFFECQERLKNMKIDERFFIPIDFSDQYYGGFMIYFGKAEIADIQYGFVEDISIAVFETIDNQLHHNLNTRKFELDFF